MPLPAFPPAHLPAFHASPARLLLRAIAAGWLAVLLWLAHAPAWGAPLALQEVASRKLAGDAQLFLAGSEMPPVDAAMLPAWLAGLPAVPQASLFGGSYWLYAELRNDTLQQDWVFDPNDTLIEYVTTRVYEKGSAAAPLLLVSGYHAPHEYLLHYGKDMRLKPGVTYQVLARFSSPYFARAPVFSVTPQPAYRKLVSKENFLIVGSIGALLALGLFNFFIYSITRDKSSLYYVLYVLTYGVAWAMTFHVFADLFDWHMLALHYVPFFLLPVLSTLFYMHFLQLKQYSPLLAKISRINLVLPLLLLPSCFFYLSYAHTLATLVIMIWMTLALVCGIVVWRRGYQPARFFVLGFVALMLPGLLILPANIGLIPALVDNAQLFTLLGGTLDGLLLAFALADQIRVLRNHLEQRVRERTLELTQTNDKLTIAKEHAEVVSRHRIDFLSAMSHDIRTPLAGVIGMLKFALRDDSVHGRTAEYLRIGLHNGESLLSILNDILDFSKIDAGKLSLETVDFDLLALLGDATGIVQGQADAKSLLLGRDLALDLPRYVRGDPTRLRQILINLLGNAIKFTASGEVRLAARTGPAAGDGHIRIDFVISDTGPGIAADVLPRLFQKFEQADHSTTRRYGGTGLGLAICKELVELMGGSIGVASEFGSGSHFHFSLPLEIGAAPATDPQQEQRHERHPYRLRVLCAEDVRTNQIIIGTLLEGMGHDVTIVDNGVQALEALNRTDFDLVLMDGRMPLMDGEQATRLIRHGGSAQYPVPDPSVPVIALTANASEHDRQRYLAAGMDSFLSKPVDERLLYDQIQTIIALLLSRGRLLSPGAALDAEVAGVAGITDAAGAAPGDGGADDALARQFGVDDFAPQRDCEQAIPIRIVPLVGLSEKHMRRITKAFLDEAPRRLQLAREALQGGNANAVAAAFHALKGSAAYLSRPRLHILCHRMENLAAADALSEVALVFPEVDSALQQACADLAASQDMA